MKNVTDPYIYIAEPTMIPIPYRISVGQCWNVFQTPMQIGPLAILPWYFHSREIHILCHFYLDPIYRDEYESEINKNFCFTLVVRLGSTLQFSAINIIFFVQLIFIEKVWLNVRYWTRIISEKSRNNRGKDHRKIPPKIDTRRCHEKFLTHAPNSVCKVIPNVPDLN